MSTTILNVIDIIALFIQVIASWFIYRNSPDNKPRGTFISENNENIEIAIMKNKRVKWSFSFLCFGFALQLISMVLKLKS